MKNPFQEPILNQPLEQTEASESFKTVTQKHGFKTLADLLQIKNSYELLKLEGFNYHLLAEYVKLLENYEVAHYLN